MFGKNKDKWMFKKKIQVNITKDGKESTIYITVNEFIEMYNKINPQLQQLKKLSEELLGHLYTVDPKNEYLLGLGAPMLKIARVAAMEIEDKVAAEDKIVEEVIDDALEGMLPGTQSGRFDSKNENKSNVPKEMPPKTWILRMKQDDGKWVKVGMVSKEEMILPEVARLRMEQPGKEFEVEEFKVV